MKMFFVLLKAQLNNRYGITAMKSNFKYDKRAFRKQIGMLAVIMFTIVYLVGFYSFLAYKLFAVTKEAGMPDIILIATVSASMIVIMLLGLIFILGFLFFAKDSAFLATLPVKPSTVFATKFFQIYLNELLFSMAFLLPAFIIYGYSMGMSFLYYLKSVIVILFIPSIPLLISSLLSMLLMGFVSKTRRRDSVMVVGGILLIVLIIVGENMLIASVPENGNANFIMAMLQSQTGLINFLGRAFPPSAWATLAVVKDNMSGFISLLSFIGLSVALLALTIPLAGKIYYKGALSQFETAKKNKKRKAVSVGKSSPAMAVFIREWKTILRSPTYALNSLVGIVMGFIIMLAPMFGGKQDSDLQGLFELISGQYSVIVLLALAGLMTLVGSINPAASTSISREGTAFWISKVIPVDYKTQITAKFFFGYSIAFAAALAVMLGAVVGFGISFNVVLGSFAISLLVMITMTAVSVILDLVRPKFDWNTETEAIKQNMNSLAAMLADLVIVVAYGGLTWLMLKFQIGDNIILIVDLLIAAVTAVLSYRYMIKFAASRYPQIEQ